MGGCSSLLIVEQLFAMASVGMLVVFTMVCSGRCSGGGMQHLLVLTVEQLSILVSIGTLVVSMMVCSGVLSRCSHAAHSGKSICRVASL